MKFLVVFLAVVGYAAANSGDAQAVVINANARARDGAQAWTDSARLHRDATQFANGIANQNLGVAGQNAAALRSATIGAGVLSTAPSWGVAAPWGVAGAWGAAPIAAGAWGAAPIAAGAWGAAPIAAGAWGAAPIAAGAWGVGGHGLVNGLGYGLGGW